MPSRFTARLVLPGLQWHGTEERVKARSRIVAFPVSVVRATPIENLCGRARTVKAAGDRRGQRKDALRAGDREVSWRWREELGKLSVAEPSPLASASASLCLCCPGEGKR